MTRKLPAGLSDSQRSDLSEFFAGHLPAGQLAERLGRGGPEGEEAEAAADGDSGPADVAAPASAVPRQPKDSRRPLLVGVVAVAIAGACAGVALGSGLLRSGPPSKAAASTVSGHAVTARHRRGDHRASTVRAAGVTGVTAPPRRPAAGPVRARVVKRSAKGSGKPSPKRRPTRTTKPTHSTTSANAPSTTTTATTTPAPTTTTASTIPTSTSTTATTTGGTTSAPAGGTTTTG